MRVGTGFDVHKLVNGRPLIIGGCRIPFDKGLLGHSDADVLLHAIMDALLGAASLGDIGQQFPDTDDRYRGVDSGFLLRQVVSLLRANGWEVGNIDCTLMGEKPKFAPYIEKMRTTIGEMIGIDVSRVSVKATTTEGLGFTGRGEGIAAQAMVLLLDHCQSSRNKVL